MHGWFSLSPESAATWVYRAVAERHCRDFNQHGVIVSSSASGFHTTLRNFAIESRPDGKLVLACNTPFVITEAGSQADAS